MVDPGRLSGTRALGRGTYFDRWVADLSGLPSSRVVCDEPDETKGIRATLARILTVRDPSSKYLAENFDARGITTPCYEQKCGLPANEQSLRAAC